MEKSNISHDPKWRAMVLLYLNSSYRVKLYTMKTLKRKKFDVKEIERPT